MGRKVYDTVIPRNVRVSEAPSYGKPVLVYDLKCVGSEAYLRLPRKSSSASGSCVPADLPVQLHRQPASPTGRTCHDGGSADGGIRFGFVTKEADC